MNRSNVCSGATLAGDFYHVIDGYDAPEQLTASLDLRYRFAIHRADWIGARQEI